MGFITGVPLKIYADLNNIYFDQPNAEIGRQWPTVISGTGSVTDTFGL